MSVSGFSTTSSNRYLFVRDLATGGMGTVSLAVREEGEFRRVYALKRLKLAYRDDPKVRAMFLQEARIAGLLHHPNAVSVIDLGEDEDGPYLVMDYVQGVSLADVIKQARAHGELIPVQLCARVMKHVADGLHAAHELRGHDGKRLELVHRDVSPQNVLIGFDGAARLSDFGIARAAGASKQTATGVLKGKFGYLSPEQLRFEAPTARSDLFSLGVVMYEMLAAERLFPGDEERDIAKKILNDAAPDIDDVRSDVHPMMVALLYDLLAKDPEARPPSAAEVSERLEEVIADLVLNESSVWLGAYLAERFADRRDAQANEIEQIQTGLVSMSFRPSRAPKRRRGRVVGAAAALALLVGATMWWTQREEPTPVAAPTPASAPEPGTAPQDTTVTETASATEPVPLSASGTPPATPTKRKAKPKRKKRSSGSKTVAPEPAKPVKAEDKPGRRDPFIEWGE